MRHPSDITVHAHRVSRLTLHFSLLWMAWKPDFFRTERYFEFQQISPLQISSFCITKTLGVHIPFSRIMYVLPVQCPLSHLMTQMGLLIYLWIAGLPVLTVSLQVLWFLPLFLPQFQFCVFYLLTKNTHRASILALLDRYCCSICSDCFLWYCLVELISFLWKKNPKRNLVELQ